MYKRQGLTVETVYDDESKEAKDTVLSQSPLQYGKVDKGTVVTLSLIHIFGSKLSWFLIILGLCFSAKIGFVMLYIGIIKVI